MEVILFSEQSKSKLGSIWQSVEKYKDIRYYTKDHSDHSDHTYKENVRYVRELIGKKRTGQFDTDEPSKKELLKLSWIFNKHKTGNESSPT
jgi:hypothetical protein